MLGLSAACAASDPVEENDDGTDTASDGLWIPLVDAAQWAPTPPEQDPALDHRPAEISCPGGHTLEGSGIEVETARCDYLSVSQPLLDEILAGEPLRIQAWWQTLASDHPAEGHLALFIDDQLQWEEFVTIPGPADARDIRWAADDDYPAGSRVTFHLHNHGANSWQLADFSILQTHAH